MIRLPALPNASGSRIGYRAISVHHGRLWAQNVNPGGSVYIELPWRHDFVTLNCQTDGKASAYFRCTPVDQVTPEKPEGMAIT